MGPIDANRRPAHFFVSYVHDSGEDDNHVRRFYTDLRNEVQLFSGLRGDPGVGFCDVVLRAGDRWSPALVDALRTCQVFLALCSPTYFRSAACGKEWTLFTRRLGNQANPAQGAASALIPIFWVLMKMHQVALPYQYRDPRFGEAYHEHGLRDLLRLDDHVNDYRRFVTALARRIVDLVETATVPADPQRPEFDDVGSAFATEAAATGWRTPRQRHPDPSVETARRDRASRTTSEMPKLNPGDPLRTTPPAGTRGGATDGRDLR